MNTYYEIRKHEMVMAIAAALSPFTQLSDFFSEELADLTAPHGTPQWQEAVIREQRELSMGLLREVVPPQDVLDLAAELNRERSASL